MEISGSHAKCLEWQESNTDHHPERLLEKQGGGSMMWWGSCYFQQGQGSWSKWMGRWTELNRAVLEENLLEKT